MNWWKSHNLEYPLLARLAKKYLCACATSSPSERLFSTSGDIVTPNRCSMKPDKVDMLTFLTGFFNILSYNYLHCHLKLRSKFDFMSYKNILY